MSTLHWYHRCVSFHEFSQPWELTPSLIGFKSSRHVMKVRWNMHRHQFGFNTCNHTHTHTHTHTSHSPTSPCSNAPSHQQIWSAWFLVQTTEKGYPRRQSHLVHRRIRQQLLVAWSQRLCTKTMLSICTIVIIMFRSFFCWLGGYPLWACLNGSKPSNRLLLFGLCLFFLGGGSPILTQPKYIRRSCFMCCPYPC